VAGIGDVRKLGRVGLKSFGYCFVISAISVIIGLALVNIIKPGKRIDAATAAGLQHATVSTPRRRLKNPRRLPQESPSRCKSSRCLFR
jgi:dicarboxylate/amino acid:cation (Na+ or H+) symporter, DAACS family